METLTKLEAELLGVITELRKTLRSCAWASSSISEALPPIAHYSIEIALNKADAAIKKGEAFPAPTLTLADVDFFPKPKADGFLSNLEAQVKALRTERDDYREQVLAVERELDPIKDERQALQERVKKLEIELKFRRDERDQLIIRIGGLNGFAERIKLGLV